MKKQFLLGLGFLATTSLFAQIPTNGLVGYYPFNGNANDLSVNGNNLTVNGATLTTDRFENTNSAYYFNGVANNLLATNTKGLNNTNYTYSFWMYNEESPASNGLSSLLELGSGGSYGQLFNLTNNYYNTTGWATGSNYKSYHSGVLPLTNTWYHVLVTRDNNTLVTYVNNVPLSIVPTNENAYYASSNNLYVGARSGLTPGQFFKGKIDDLRFYDRVLNQEEIAALFTENSCLQKISVTDTLVIKINITTGAQNDLVKSTIKLFPNPTNSILNVDFGNYLSLDGFSLSISNLNGQEVYNSKINQASTTINIANLGASGTYFVKVIDKLGNVIEVKKLILN